MKKPFIKAKIYVLSLCSLFLAYSCNDKTTSKEKKKQQIQQQIDSISQVLSQREHSTIYGPPEIMVKYVEEERKMQKELDSLNQMLNKIR